ncbi:hypothetical protein ASC65_08820 [Brevundimonas sp. Root1279]|nr:hypothetical protein ASC65_08820 [Brevundimonas sp. Root1279]
MSSTSTTSEPTVLAHEADFHLGELLVRPSLGEVGANGATQHLEPRVMRVLVALVRAEGAVLSRDDLIIRCWDGVIVGDDAVSRIISKLRRLSNHEGAGFQIETVPRIGYRLAFTAATPRVSAGRTARLRSRVGARRLARRWGFVVPLALGSVAALLVIVRLAPTLRSSLR